MKRLFITEAMQQPLVNGLVCAIDFGLGLLLVLLATVMVSRSLTSSNEAGMGLNTWAQIPAGEFYFGQHEDAQSTDTYEMIITDVTTAQYADFLNVALVDGYVKVAERDEQLFGFYPGDEFHGVKHEAKIDAGDWLFIPRADLLQRIDFNVTSFTVQPVYENHPMTSVTWFGAWGYCEYYDYQPKSNGKRRCAAMIPVLSHGAKRSH